MISLKASTALFLIVTTISVASDASVSIGGSALAVKQETEYPWAGHVRLRLTPDSARAFDVKLRIPGWAAGRPVPSDLYQYLDANPGSYELRVNGQRVTPTLSHGYAVVSRTWAPGDEITLDLPMTVRRVVADQRVEDDRGRIALERGPLVYAAEAVDNNGSVLDIVVPDTAAFETEHDPELLGGVTLLKAAVEDRKGKARRLTAIPYYAWSHRGTGEMAVWLKRGRE